MSKGYQEQIGEAYQFLIEDLVLKHWYKICTIEFTFCGNDFIALNKQYDSL
jgi:hypothetical protein